MPTAPRLTVFICLSVTLFTGCSQKNANDVTYQITLIDTRTTETIKQSTLYLPTRLDQNFRGHCRWGKRGQEEKCRVSLQNGTFTLSYFPEQDSKKQFVLEGNTENGESVSGRVQFFNGQSVQMVAFFKVTYQNRE